MAEVIRGAAGELSDLVEDNLVQDKGQTSTPPKEETRGLTSGPVIAPDAKRESEAASEETLESSEEEEVEEIEEEEEDKTKQDSDKKDWPVEPREPAGRAPAEPDGGPRESEGSGRHLELYPAPKRSTQAVRERPSLVRYGPQKRRPSEGDRSEPDPAALSSGGIRRGNDDEDSQGREPIQRRRQEKAEAQSEGHKGGEEEAESPSI